MKSLCFLVALMAVVIASPESGSEELRKRLIGGLLPTEGGLVGSFLGKGGLVGGFLGNEEGGFLGGIIDRLKETVGNVLETVTALLESLIKSLEGKTKLEDIYAQFRTVSPKLLCSSCGTLVRQDLIKACERYCGELAARFGS